MYCFPKYQRFIGSSSQTHFLIYGRIVVCSDLSVCTKTNRPIVTGLVGEVKHRQRKNPLKFGSESEKLDKKRRFFASHLANVGAARVQFSCVWFRVKLVRRHGGVLYNNYETRNNGKLQLSSSHTSKAPFRFCHSVASQPQTQQTTTRTNDTHLHWGSRSPLNTHTHFLQLRRLSSGQTRTNLPARIAFPGWVSLAFPPGDAAARHRGGWKGLTTVPSPAIVPGKLVPQTAAGTRRP